MVRHSSDVSRAPRKLICRPNLGIAPLRRRWASYRTRLGILAVLTCGGWATLDAQAVDTVPARLIDARGDTAAIVVPDTVSRGQEFTVMVTAFAGGCISEPGGSRVRVHGLVADVRPLNVRRVAGNVCSSDELLFRQTISLRFDRAGVGRIRFHGAANKLYSGTPPQCVVIERRVVVR